jgi:hypothetical protein
VEEDTHNSVSFIARKSYLQPQTIREVEVTKVVFARFTQEVDVDLDLCSLSGTSPRPALEMESGGGTGSGNSFPHDS